jgi:hypothetical protein
MSAAFSSPGSTFHRKPTDCSFFLLHGWRHFPQSVASTDVASRTSEFRSSSVSRDDIISNSQSCHLEKNSLAGTQERVYETFLHFQDGRCLGRTAWGVQRGRRWPQAVCPAGGPPRKSPHGFFRGSPTTGLRKVGHDGPR